MYWNCIRRFSFGATTESESPISRKIPTGHQNFFLRRSLISARHGTAPWWLFFYLFCCCFETTHELHFAHFSFVKKKILRFSLLAQILENFPLRTPIPPVFSHTCQRVGENPGNETLIIGLPLAKLTISVTWFEIGIKNYGEKLRILSVWKIFCQVNLRIDHYVNVAMITYYHAFVRSTSSVASFLTLFSYMFVRKFVFVEIISLLLHCKLARVPASVWIKLSIKIFNSIHSIFYKNLSYRRFSLKFAKISRTVLRTRRKIYFSLLLLCKIQKNWIT